MFCFSQTEPSADLLNGPSWATSEGTQNFPDFADNVSSHSGEAEEYIVTSGHNTPRGSIHMSRTRTNGGSWAPTGLPQVSAGGHAMSRVDSSRSTGSMLSHSSHPSNMDVAGNGSAFRHGSQVAPGNIVGADPYLMMESEASTLAQGYWPAYHLPSGLDMDNAPFPVAEAAPMHVVPSQMQFGPDTTLADHTSPTSWQNFPAPGTRTSSPATIDDTWLHPQGPISPPNSSPEIPCQSPRYVSHAATAAQRDSPLSPEALAYQPRSCSMDFGSHMNGSGMPSLPEGMALASPMSSRREGESARNHDLYKNVKPHEDGLFHCPFEGRDDCQHKPEKLKCNYEYVFPSTCPASQLQASNTFATASMSTPTSSRTGARTRCARTPSSRRRRACSATSARRTDCTATATSPFCARTRAVSAAFPATAFLASGTSRTT